MNVPEGWEEADSTSIRVDYVDPQDSIARIRLLVEDSGRPAHEFVTDIAEPTIAGNCAGPYQRVDLTDIELDGHPATLLEYTCGEGQDATAPGGPPPSATARRTRSSSAYPRTGSTSRP